MRLSVGTSAIKRRRALNQVVNLPSSITSTEVFDTGAQVLQTIAVVGAIERRWALDHTIDRSNKEAPNWIWSASSSPGWREFILKFVWSFPRSFGCPVNSFQSPFLEIKTRQHPKISVMLLIIEIPWCLSWTPHTPLGNALDLPCFCRSFSLPRALKILNFVVGFCGNCNIRILWII